MSFVIDKQGEYLPVFGEYTGGDIKNSYLAPDTTLTVKTDGTGDFTSLNDAISYLTGKWSTGTVNINIAAGTYTTTSKIDIAGTSFNIPRLIISGASADTTIISCATAQSSGIIRVLNTWNDIRIRLLTIQGAGKTASGGIGIMAQNNSLPVYTEQVKIKDVEIGYKMRQTGVSKILNFAFENCGTAVSVEAGSTTLIINPSYTNVTTQLNQTKNTLTYNGIIYCE